MKVRSVRLDDAQFAALPQLGEQLGKTRSQPVKRSISALAQQKPHAASPYALAEQIGLIGSFQGRADLSENVTLRVRQKLRAKSARVTGQ